MALQTLDIGNNFASNLAKNFDCYGIQLKVNDVYKFSYDKSLWKLEINNVETDEFYIYAMCESSLVTGINYTDFDDVVDKVTAFIMEDSNEKPL